MTGWPTDRALNPWKAWGTKCRLSSNPEDFSECQGWADKAGQAKRAVGEKDTGVATEVIQDALITTAKPSRSTVVVRPVR
jgi:hypothetical protein